MNWILGRKTLAETVKENKRLIDRNVLELDIEKIMLEQQESAMVSKIKGTAKSGRMSSVKLMAKSLVKTRRQIDHILVMRMRLQDMSFRMSSLRSTESMARTLKQCTSVMTKLNRTLEHNGTKQLVFEFERQTDALKIHEEQLDEALDDEDVNSDEETEEDVVNKVLDELGVDIKNLDVPSLGPTVEELADRFERLKK